MTVRQVSSASDGDDRLAALMTNANAIGAIAAAVEGTIGPKGLDTMLVDSYGEVVITNAGVTILDKMDVNHPAARMLINIAKAQQEEIGDGTTTCTIIAGALVGSGVEQVVRGVPVARVIEGMRIGLQRATAAISERSRSLDGLDAQTLGQVALIAGREHQDIAQLVVSAAKLVGNEKLCQHGFKLSEIVTAQEGGDNQVFMGVVVAREPINAQSPKLIDEAKVLVIDDALEPEEIGAEALGTETGFAKYLEYQQEFKNNINKIIELGVTLLVVDRNVLDVAEEMLTDAGVMVLHRVSSKELRKVAEHTGARAIKRTGLQKSAEELRKCLGQAEKVFQDERLQHVRIQGGSGKPMATILVGAATAEVVGERERIAKDAASSVQAAVRGGVVPGGGAIELAVARDVAKARELVKGMSAYGVDCVVEALKKPLAQIIVNAGFNPLEKVEEIHTMQLQQGVDSLAMNCDTGEVVDMIELGVLDPALVKSHAIKAAGEIAEAILRIDTIIKKKEDSTSQVAPSPSMNF